MSIVSAITLNSAYLCIQSRVPLAQTENSTPKMRTHPSNRDIKKATHPNHDTKQVSNSYRKICHCSYSGLLAGIFLDSNLLRQCNIIMIISALPCLDLSWLMLLVG